MTGPDLTITAPCLSVVVVAFNMPRELPRTIRSLSPAMQRGIDPRKYEIVVVDNGSTQPFDRRLCQGFGADITFCEMALPRPSPAAAINAGLQRARGDLICVMIDGARLASPGLLNNALLAARLHDRPVIASLAFHLGPALQRISIANGYNQDVEDALLASVDWTTNGYRLFEISVFGGSSAGGWFRPISESSALFLRRKMWEELGGYDERFTSPGGGLVNLDAYYRACGLPGSQLVVLLGEGTFHQFHGGVMTNAVHSPLEGFNAEYVSIRGKPYMPPAVPMWLFGQARPETLASIEDSARFAR